MIVYLGEKDILACSDENEAKMIASHFATGGKRWMGDYERVKMGDVVDVQFMSGNTLKKLRRLANQEKIARQRNKNRLAHAYAGIGVN